MTTTPTVIVPSTVPKLPSATSVTFAPPPDWRFWVSTASRTNSAQPVDVNNDRIVTPLDAITIINALNALSGKAEEGESAFSSPNSNLPKAVMRDTNSDSVSSATKETSSRRRFGAATERELDSSPLTRGQRAQQTDSTSAELKRSERAMEALDEIMAELSRELE